MGTHRTTQSPPPAAVRRRQPTGRRLPAVVALAGAVLMVTSGLGVAVDDFPRGLRRARVRRGRRRRRRGRASCAAGGPGWGRSPWPRRRSAGAASCCWSTRASSATWRCSAAGALIWHVGARLAFRPVAAWPPADRPRRPVLFVNPRSGGGKADRFRLAAEARDTRDRGGGAGARGGPRGAGAAGRGRRCGRPGHGRWRRLAGRRRRRGGGRRAPLRLHPRRAPATTSRSTSASTATTWSAPSTRSSTAASAGRPRRGQRPGVREQRVAGGLRGGGAAAGLPRCQDADPGRHRVRRPRPGPGTGRSDLRWTTPGGRTHAGRRRSSSWATTSTGWAAPPARAPGRRSTRASSG